MRSVVFTVLLEVATLARAKVHSHPPRVLPASAQGLSSNRLVAMARPNYPSSASRAGYQPLFSSGYNIAGEKQTQHQRLVARANAGDQASPGDHLESSVSNKKNGFMQNMFSKGDQKKHVVPSKPTKPCVAVFGATGRVGQLVVKSLLNQDYCVKALVRNATKASKVLPADVDTTNLDLSTASAVEVQKACDGMTAAIWCASGFTPDMTSVDMMGMKVLPEAFSSASTGESKLPRIVMCSSAGVTRPSWDDESKKKLVGAADIPIVRLNPGGILGKKVEAEDLLRQSGVPYSIVRPTGLKFDPQEWSPGRPVFSQGDVAVGRTSAQVLADVLVSVLKEPHATGKTFEMLTLQGYPAPRTLGNVLDPLKRDDEGPLDASEVLANYKLLQQLLPGEEQDATKLEIGRSYEQVDRGEVARERGAAATTREKELAASVVKP